MSSKPIASTLVCLLLTFTLSAMNASTVSSSGTTLNIPDEEASSTWTVEDGVRLEGGWPGNPSVIELPDGTYRMYFSDAEILIIDHGSEMHEIKSAVSADGLTWTKEDGIRVGYGYGGEAAYASTPEVTILEDGRYRMYYYHEFYYAGSHRGQILSAISADGLTWTKEPGIRVDYGGTYDALRVLSPNIIKLSNGTYRMYYSGNDGEHYRILSAVSTDGLTWTKEAGIRIDIGGIYDSLHVGQPQVIKIPDGRYMMFYVGFDEPWSGRILSAVSQDGLTWTKETGIRIDREGIEGGPYSIVNPGDVIKLSDNQYRMYFGADRYPWEWRDRLRIFSAIGTIPLLSIEATIDIDPDTLNLKSRGKWITCYIELPRSYNVGDIDINSITLNGLSAEWGEVQDGVLMVKFDRQAVQRMFSAEDVGNVELTVSGEVDGIPFEGSDTIRVIMPGKGKGPQGREPQGNGPK